MSVIKDSGVVEVYRGNVCLSMCIHWKIVLVSAVCLAITAPRLFASEQTHEIHQDSGHYHLNMLEVFLGNTHEDAHHESEDGFTIGFTYERRFSELLGMGGFYEYAAGDFDKWSVGVPLFIHPYEGFRFALAPGLEHRHGDDEFLFRAGVGYEFELSERWIVMPEFNVDFVDGDESLVFGLTLGYGF
ncbi:MAG TPA: hypothetical protein VMW24_13955 [Sedimentisphaerales bacterium]|nr:hypothetical protein [Sedimentisphaerales bacterium]